MSRRRYYNNRSRNNNYSQRPRESGFHRFMRTGSTGNSLIDMVASNVILSCVTQGINALINPPEPVQAPPPQPRQQPVVQERIIKEVVYVDEFGEEIPEEEVYRCRRPRRPRRPMRPNRDEYYDGYYNDVVDVTDDFYDERGYGMVPYQGRRR